MKEKLKKKRMIISAYCSTPPFNDTMQIRREKKNQSVFAHFYT